MQPSHRLSMAITLPYLSNSKPIPQNRTLSLLKLMCPPSPPWCCLPSLSWGRWELMKGYKGCGCRNLVLITLVGQRFDNEGFKGHPQLINNEGFEGYPQLIDRRVWRSPITSWSPGAALAQTIHGHHPPIFKSTLIMLGDLWSLIALSKLNSTFSC